MRPRNFPVTWNGGRRVRSPAARLCPPALAQLERIPFVSKTTTLIFLRKRDPEGHDHRPNNLVQIGRDQTLIRPI